jgi:hypothetical protein
VTNRNIYYYSKLTKTILGMSCPVRKKEDTVSEAGSESSCPVNHNAINPLTMMPPADQRPARGQQTPLSTHRDKSTIPIGSYVPKHQEEGQETWKYPSEQQYFNAMTRKGWKYAATFDSLFCRALYFDAAAHRKWICRIFLRSTMQSTKRAGMKY